MSLPITAVTKPTDLVGLPNGMIPTAVMTPIVRADGASDYGHHLAVRALKAMLATLEADTGIALTWTPGGAYRSLTAQTVLFRSRYYPVTLAEHQDNPGADRWWPGNGWWRRKSGVAAAAVPGTSNHGLALAWDLAAWDPVERKYLAIPAKAVGWLVVNAILYGFSAELQSEPWHWRYVTGDRLPRAVLDFEGSTPIPPPDPIEEDLVSWTVVTKACTRQASGRLAHYRAERRSDGGIRVWGVNGAPIAKPTGSAFGSPFTDLPTQEPVEFLGLVEAPDHGGAVATYGQGITLDVPA